MKNPLDTWDGLNDTIRDAGELACILLLKEELKGKRRSQYVLRIHSRLNRMRADRERKELHNVLLNKAPVKDLRWLR